MKPILFNADMVRAILDGRKTVTRRPIKPQPVENPALRMCSDDVWRIEWWDVNEHHAVKVPFRMGDILYARETFRLVDFDYIDDDWSATVQYKADSGCGPRIYYLGEGVNERIGWRPSIHMPKEVARIFLRVTDVRPEQLRDMTEESARAEGFANRAQAIKAILVMYPDCTEDSWFWVNEFERISRKEAIKDGFTARA